MVSCSTSIFTSRLSHLLSTVYAAAPRRLHIRLLRSLSGLGSRYSHSAGGLGAKGVCRAIGFCGLESATVSHVPTTPSLHTVSPPRWPFKIAVFHPVPVCFRPHPSVFADKCSSRYYSTSIIVNVAMVVTNVSKLSSGPAELWQQVIHSFPSLHFLSRCPLAAAMFRCRGHAATSLYRSCSGRGQ
ncbi:hypothetical protein B0H13DRAFT_750250 [Mycena leptocephala]|nr:hypothetical protein B0H13DRAFT_750250 [Mycena leptocephala]